MSETHSAHSHFGFMKRQNFIVTLISFVGILAHLFMRFFLRLEPSLHNIPILLVLGIGTPFLIWELIKKILAKDLGSDLLAGIAIITSIVLHEYLAGSILILMLSGGALLEEFAVNRASSVLRALAQRTPKSAHLKKGVGMVDIEIEAVAIGDALVILPHEIVPVDGVVIDGHGSMDESFLTGEPYHMSKAPGSDVMSGAVNGSSAFVIRATKKAVDSRFSKIMDVVKSAEQNPPRLRRLGDRFGAIYAPVAMLVAIGAWVLSGDPQRFLAVLVVATPCPLILAIPIAVIGAISLCARRGIIVRKPAALEQINSCRVIVFDKTGTLTYGAPKLTEVLVLQGVQADDVLSLAASLEHYSRHPLAQAVLTAAEERKLALEEASQITEKPGEGVVGIVGNKKIQMVGRKHLPQIPELFNKSQQQTGLECFVLIDGVVSALFRFRDEPREEGVPFISHLGPKHEFERKIILSGDRESEAKYLAARVGIDEVYAGKSPEEKLAIIREITAKNKTIYVGDGINDAPPLLAATVGIAMGQNSDITAEAASIVILDNSLSRIDEFLHISERMRRIALQSALGGMALSTIAMFVAASGHLPVVGGAITQEVIDLLAILNALRCTVLPKVLTDY